MEKTIVIWECPVCGIRQSTSVISTAPYCEDCGMRYDWCAPAFLSHVSHQESVDDDGNFDADAYDPTTNCDIDEAEPEPPDYPEEEPDN